MRNQRAGSSCFGFLIVISSRMVIGSPFFRCVTISLFIVAWPRTLTLFCLAAPGSGCSTGSDFAAIFGSAFLAAGFVAPFVCTFGLAGAGEIAVEAGADVAPWAATRSVRQPNASAVAMMARKEIFIDRKVEK